MYFLCNFRYNGGKFRKAQAAWFSQYKWLRYSMATDGVFCAPCCLFGENDPRAKTLVKSTATDWCNMKKILERHEKSEHHTGCCHAASNFTAIQNGASKDIESTLNSQYNSLVEKNRKIMMSIVDAIIFCGRQNIALRGHREEEGRGNFQALLHYQAKHDDILRQHLRDADPRTKYTSPSIQNEIIDLCGQSISEKLVQMCNTSGIFSLIADEATDAATMEQMALCVRYLEKDEVREDFLGFAVCASTTGESLANAFLDNLTKLGNILHLLVHS